MTRQTPTRRQKNLAKRIVEASNSGIPITAGELLKSTEYSVSSQKQPSRIINTEGVQKALEDFGFTEDNAKKQVASILNYKVLNELITPENQLRAADMVFKAFGTYTEKPPLTVNINSFKDLSNDDLERIIREANTSESRTSSTRISEKTIK